MAELDSVHSYAAGALMVLALHHAQIHQLYGPSSLEDSIDGTGSCLWTSQESGLLRHVFRHLKIEPKAWDGLENTAVSSGARHHIGPFIRLLAEDDNSSSSTLQCSKISEGELANAVHAMDARTEEACSPSAISKSCTCKADSDIEDDMVGSSRKLPEIKQGEEDLASILPSQRKIAVLYELLVACISSDVIKQGYDARHRVALRLLSTWFNMKWSKVAAMEILVAHIAMAARKEKQDTSTEDTEEKKSYWDKWKHGGIIGAAALTGGTLLAVTGGLAAPAIAAGLSAMAPAIGTIIPGFAAAAAATGTAAGSAAVAASFGVAGASLTGSKMARRIGGIDEFGFEEIGDNHHQGRLGVGIVVSGIVFEEDDFTRPWDAQDGDLERYALRWESKHLMAVSTAIQDWLTTAVAGELMKQGAMMTVLSGLITAFAWPSALLSITNFIDSKWAIAVDRSDKAGKLLADCLLRDLQGSRPVTLVGFSLGARVIFSCLQELAAKVGTASIVERVVLLGAPLKLEKQQWEKVRKVVAGRFVNGYSRNDWILGVVYRSSLLTQGLAGVQAVDVPGFESVDLTDYVPSHSSYLSRLKMILGLIDIDSCYPVVL